MNIYKWYCENFDFDEGNKFTIKENNIILNNGIISINKCESFTLNYVRNDLKFNKTLHFKTLEEAMLRYIHIEKSLLGV